MVGQLAHPSEGLLGGVKVRGGPGEGVRDGSGSVCHGTQPRACTPRLQYTAGPGETRERTVAGCETLPYFTDKELRQHTHSIG